MLTNEDLFSITEIVRKEVRSELRKELTPIQKKLQNMDNKIDTIESDLEAAIRLFDSDFAEHDKRITWLEACCGHVADEDR